jgi:hypothetical protein
MNNVLDCLPRAVVAPPSVVDRRMLAAAVPVQTAQESRSSISAMSH